MPFCGTALFFECHQWFAPTELEEWIIGSNLTANARILVLWIGGVRTDPYILVLPDLIDEIFIVGIEEDESVLLGAKKVIELTFRLDDSLEGTEALQMSPTHIRN